MKKPELLLPAGNIEKMEYALAYGADAVYCGLSEYSLRSLKAGDVISLENLKKAVDTAHAMNSKVYLTFNIFAHNSQISSIREILSLINDVKPDGLVFSDPGVFNVLKSELRDVPLHLSTQANTLNYESVKFWRDLGVKRVVLARELSLKEIIQIRKNIPDIELEMFVHGSLCMSYSGRCLLSNYMTGNTRRANQGDCAQPCRWNYRLLEEKRPGEYYEIFEDEKGTYIMSPKDLCLIEHIPELTDAGIDSFKIEGRTKSVYYAASIAKTYRSAIDSYLKTGSINKKELLAEISKIGSRNLTKGFLLDKPDNSHYNYESNKSVSGSTVLAIVTGMENGMLKLKIKNKMQSASEVEFIAPDEQYVTKIAEIKDLYHNKKLEAANVNDEVLVSIEKFPLNWQRGIIRSL